ncbi:insecticidal delta-endotoxin Cry8Ea1 family protein, partial [Bacillus sp. D-CC]
VVLFQSQERETVLLPTYAAAATTHLIVLQDVIKFGKVYGFEEKIIEDLYITFTKLIEEYTIGVKKIPVGNLLIFIIFCCSNIGIAF